MKTNHFFFANVLATVALTFSACGPDPCIGKECENNNGGSLQQEANSSSNDAELSSSRVPPSSSSITPSSSSSTINGSSSSTTPTNPKCGNEEYNPATTGCCNNGKYVLATQFCYNNAKIGEKCGLRKEIFDPDEYEYRDNCKIYLKEKTKDATGNEYDAVLIGSQTWLAENLNYDVPGSVCYDNKSANCDKYGRLYNWETALVVCPEGWHLPSDGEWATLINYVGSSTKLTNSDWYGSIGTDDYGFATLPGGICTPEGVFLSGGSTGDSYWWSSTEENIDRAYGRRITLNQIQVDYFNKTYLRSVRCVKN